MYYNYIGESFKMLLKIDYLQFSVKCDRQEEEDDCRGVYL